MKRWLYPTGVERDYLAALRRDAVRPLEQAVRDVLLPALPGILQALRQDADPRDIPQTTGWFEQLRQALIGTLAAAEAAPATLTALVRRYATRVEEFNRREFDGVLRSVYGADTPPAAIRAALQASQSGSSIEQAFRRTLEQSGLDRGEIDRLASRAFPANGEINRTAFRESMRRALGVDVITGDAALQTSMRVWEAENIALIKSIPEQAVSRLQGQITEAVRRGQSLASLTSQIKEEFGVTDRRAKLIARDQIGKLNGQITQYRQQDIGVDSYKWRGILDQRERQEHVLREGKVYAWDKPPDDGHPGEPVRCRCTAEPVLPSWAELEERVTGEKPPEGTYTPTPDNPDRPVPPEAGANTRRRRAPAPAAPQQTAPPAPVAPRPVPRATPPEPVRALQTAVPNKPITQITAPASAVPTVPARPSGVTASLKKPLTADEQSYVDYYKGDGFKKMNETLRNPGAFSAGELDAAKKMQTRVDDAIGKSAFDTNGRLYRGIRSREVFDNAEAMVGGRLPIKTPQSTATSEGSALSWSGLLRTADGKTFSGSPGESLIMRVNVKAGQRGLNMERMAQGNTGENEILLPSGGAYRVTGVEAIKDANGRTIGKYLDVDLE